MKYKCTFCVLECVLENKDGSRNPTSCPYPDEKSNTTGIWSKAPSQLSESPAIPQQPQGEICSNNYCAYCSNADIVCDIPHLTGCANFVGRKLSPVR